jgi:hypothetical protein
MKSVLASLQQTLANGLAVSRQHTSVGPFSIYHTQGDATTWMNYAIPTRDADLIEIAAMVEAFRALDRTPRLEFIQ